MTEVEKIELKYKNAEESFEKWIDENCYKNRSNEYFESLYRVRKEAFANGYEQGQKDYKEFCECFCLKDGKFIQVQLEKENEELKATISKTETITEKNSEIEKLKTQIDKMKCCQNCKHYHIDYEGKMLCKIVQQYKTCKKWEMWK